MKIKGYQRVKVEGEFKNINEFHRKHPCSKISHINGKKADYICENCEKAIESGESAFVWTEDIYTCLECASDSVDHIPETLE